MCQKGTERSRTTEFRKSSAKPLAKNHLEPFPSCSCPFLPRSPPRNAVTSKRPLHPSIFISRCWRALPADTQPLMATHRTGAVCSFAGCRAKSMLSVVKKAKQLEFWKKLHCKQRSHDGNTCAPCGIVSKCCKCASNYGRSRPQKPTGSSIFGWSHTNVDRWQQSCRSASHDYVPKIFFAS